MSNPGRNSTPNQRLTLKLASQRAVNTCGGGIEAAKMTDVDPSTLSLYSALHEFKRYMRIDVALDLDLAAGEPIMARALAGAQGWSLTRDEAVTDRAALGHADYGRFQRESFEAQSVLFEIIDGRPLSTDQKRRILKELADLRQAIAIVEAKVEGAYSRSFAPKCAATRGGSSARRRCRTRRSISPSMARPWSSCSRARKSIGSGRRDGTVLGFTEHDVDLTFDGVTYTASGGFTATQLVQNLGVSVDNMNVDGALSDSSLNEDDLAGGLYDGATVELWRVNWQDVSQRLLMNSATLGEVTRNGSSFSAELRGLTHKLGQKTGRTFQRTCDAKLGGNRCGVDLSLSQYRGTGQVDALDNGRVFTAIGINSFDSDWFTAGLLTFEGGANSGLGFEVKRHLKKAGSVLIELWQKPPHTVAPADGFTITSGCKQTAAVCHGKFDNIANFRGFNLMPGPDAVLFYPKRGGGQDGGSLVGN